jgi:predicted DNA binding CopG/RHH family protein
MKRPIQYFSDEALERSRDISPLEIITFLESFRNLHLGAKSAQPESRLISIKIPVLLLEAFRARSQTLGVPYQTQIKALMKQWLTSGEDS